MKVQYFIILFILLSNIENVLKLVLIKFFFFNCRRIYNASKREKTNRKAKNKNTWC